MAQINLDPKQVAKRWRITTATLRQWRWNGKGPEHFKIEGRTLYSLEEIEKFEEKMLRQHTTAVEK